MNREEVQTILKQYRNKNDLMELLWTIDDILFEPFDDDGEHQFIFATGDFEGNYDYDRGFLVVKIRTFTDWNDSNKHCVEMVILNIDDGIWRAVSKWHNSLDKVKNVCDDLAKKLRSSYGNKLPTEKELNDFLNQFGMYGYYEG